MKPLKILFVAATLIILTTSLGTAGDFDWVRDFNIQAEADPSGFRARLATRFRIGDVEVKSVIGRVGKPADVFMVLRLGEMSNRPTDDVIKEYKAGKGKGWGVLAKKLGIKPGSEEFHALKRGHDLHADGKSKAGDREKVRDKEKDKDKGKGKNR